jgi:predicted nucleotidyltransferase component of viral defense system
MTPAHNVAASILARLRMRARERGEDVQFVQHRYASERFLYRLGESAFRDRFVLKGAMLYALWGGPAYRPTRDLDLTGYGDSDPSAVLEAFREICGVAVPGDGIVFDASTLVAEPIREEVEYGGLRVKFRAMLGAARIPMQVDVGFGNAIQPSPLDVVYPPLLDAPAPRIRAYPQEAVVAEKLHAMVTLGERNSRYKDFYDLYALSGQFPFDGTRLASAVSATFERRRTPIEGGVPLALTPRFYAEASRGGQWRAYLRRSALPGAPATFEAVGERVSAFAGPVWEALAKGASINREWLPGGGWR